ITSAAIEAAIASGEIYGGMIPKVEAMMQATQQGIPEVVIRSGKNALATGTQIKEELHECTTTHLSTY
ncbi:MAG: acetylglutamate kinase, partial [Exiguobacterium acetylicum]